MKNYNLKELEKILKKGDYYSKNVETKDIFILPKKNIDEISKCLEFENVDIDREEKQSAILFIMGIIRDLIERKEYKIIKGVKEGENEQ